MQLIVTLKVNEGDTLIQCVQRFIDEVGNEPDDMGYNDPLENAEYETGFVDAGEYRLERNEQEN